MDDYVYPTMPTLKTITHSYASSMTAKKKSRLLEPMTEEEWNALSGKAKWDSTVALRGPDLTGSELLKWFTTSVIRFRLSKIMRVGGMVNESLGFVLLPQGGAPHRDDRFDIGHFLNHVTEAAVWLGIPIVYTSQDTFSILLNGSYYSDQKKVLTILSGETTGKVQKRLKALLGLSYDDNDQSLQEEI